MPLNEFLNEPVIKVWDDSLKATQLVTESENGFTTFNKQFRHKPVHIVWAENKKYENEGDQN